MRKFFLCLSVLTYSILNAQSDEIWTKQSALSKNSFKTAKAVNQSTFPKTFDLYELNTTVLRNKLFSTLNKSSKQSVMVSIPNAKGKIEQFELVEASNFDEKLQAQFPEIRAYSGKGVTDPNASLKLSYSPDGIKTMVMRTNNESEFLEPYSEDNKVYALYSSKNKMNSRGWSCDVKDEEIVHQITNKVNTHANRGSSSGEIKTLRVALSCTGEYANYFGATTQNQNTIGINKVLSAFNATLTRCNGVFEKDLALHLILIAESTKVIYFDPNTDPYTTSWSAQQQRYVENYNLELQNTLSNRLGATLAVSNSLYDIGHVFGKGDDNGNAGCIGCICRDDTSATNDENKGSGFTVATAPTGDVFDIDYVAHEMGHQLGANHTYSYVKEGYGVNKEVGSGVTIMGYANITGQDAANKSIPFFHHASIEQIKNNLATKTCPVTTNISNTNAAPNVEAGLDYTIPKSTPFILTGTATDANQEDYLTYSWEQNDDGVTNTGTSSVASETKSIGPNWISWEPSPLPTRFFPKIETVIANSRTTLGNGNDGINVEALSSVSRTLNFRLTVRDNVLYRSTAPVTVGQTGHDDMVVTVTANAGPFVITTQDTNVNYPAYSVQIVKWNVAGTNSNGVNCSKVTILLSTDGGYTYPITLIEETENDGEAIVSIPNILGNKNRIMVKGLNHIFFDINNANFTISTGTAADNTPTNLTANTITQTTTNLSWRASSIAATSQGVTYNVYKNSELVASNITGTTTTISNLTPSTDYFFSVKAVINGGTSQASNIVKVTTLSKTTNPDTQSPTKPVELKAIENTITETSVNLIWKQSDDNFGAVTRYDIYRKGNNAGYALIESINGLIYFANSLRPGTEYTFYVVARDAAGNFSERSNEVTIITLDSEAPTAPQLSHDANATTQTSVKLTWTASTDNGTLVGYRVFRGNTQINTTNAATREYTDTGLNHSTEYSYTVTAIDLKGNLSIASNIRKVKTLAPSDNIAPTAPTNLTASSTTQTTTNLNWTASYDAVGVVKYDVYRQLGAATIKIGSATTNNFQVTGLTAATSYNFWVVALDAANNESSKSNTVNVITTTNSSGGTTTTPTYCTITSTYGSYENIANVKFGSINNPSSATSGYEDFTTIATDLAKNSTTAIAITPKWSDSKFDENYKVYIDYNQDGDFRDTGEEVFTKDATQDNPVNGNITIPSTASLGKTRMRIILCDKKISGPCENIIYGQIEDYTVNIKEGTSTTGDTTGGQTTVLVYCESKGGNTSDERIQKVEFNKISNASTGADGYEDFTKISTKAAKSSTYKITITPQWMKSSKYNEAYAVWIDYNQDGKFDGTDERVFSKTPSKDVTVSGTVEIPASAKIGQTRMRVSMKYYNNAGGSNDLPISCDKTIQFGQVEDYTVEIVNAGEADSKTNMADINISDIVLYPNPVNTVLTISNTSDVATYRVYNLLGQNVLEGKLVKQLLDVSTLTKGIYVIEINDNEKLTTKRFLKE